MPKVYRESYFYAGTTRWIRWGISNELHKSFLLLWVEMFHEKTLDSWRARTCNTRSLLRELIAASQLTLTHDKYKHHLDPLIQETLYTAARDPVVATACPFLDATLKQAQTEGPRALAIACEVALTHLEGYREAVVHALRTHLESGQPAAKDKLIRLALALGTEVASGSHSLDHLRRSSRFLRELPTTPFLDRFDALMHGCSGRVSEYKCLFRIPPPLATFVTSFDDLRIAPRPEAPTQQETSFYQQAGHRDLVVELTVHAADAYEARRAGELALNRMAATITAFRPQESTSLKDAPALITRADGFEHNIVEARERPVRHAQGITRVTALLPSVAKFVKESPGETARVYASLEHHHLAVHATSDEIRLLNLWTALESLVSGDGLTIQRVLDWIPPAMGLRYGIKHLRALRTHVMAWCREQKCFPALAPAFPKIELNQSVSEGDFFDVLVQAPKTDGIEALFAVVDQPVIRHRMSELHKTLRDPKLLVSASSQHVQNVDWQIRRIYRARNMIVHQGTAPPALRELVDHLHTYYVHALRGLLEDVTVLSYRSFATCFGHRKVLWQAFRSGTWSVANIRRWLLEPTTFYR